MGLEGRDLVVPKVCNLSLMENIQAEKWAQKYKATQSHPVYPTEWVIRTIAGANYPNFKFSKELYKGKKIVDLSCGDGRNLGLLMDLGFEVHATEISEEAVSILERRFPNVKFTVGLNHKNNLPDNHFDFALACGSFYYLEPNTSFVDNLKELNRILKPNGIFFANMSTEETYVLNQGRKLDNNEILILNDPHGFRNGYRWQTANSEVDVNSLFNGYLKILACSRLKDDYFGYLISNFILVASNIKS